MNIEIAEALLFLAAIWIPCGLGAFVLFFLYDRFADWYFESEETTTLEEWIWAIPSFTVAGIAPLLVVPFAIWYDWSMAVDASKQN